jgi:uncharacterized protein
MLAVARRSRGVFLLVLWLTGTFMPAQPSQSAPAARLAAVAVDPTPQGIALTIDLTAPFLPSGVSLASPDRLVFDFPGFSLQGPARRIPVNHSGIEDVRVALFSVSPPMSRIVADSRQALKFEIKAVGNRVVIDIAAPDVGPAAADVVHPAASVTRETAPSQTDAFPEKTPPAVLGSDISNAEKPATPLQRKPGAYALQSKARDLKLEDLQALEDKAEAGDAEAETILGLAYHAGILLKKDDALAVALLHKAADQKFMAADESLGIFAETGVSRREPAPAEAIEWYKKAVQLGSLDAATNIGLMYADGNGVPKDPAQAIIWFRRAATGGDSIAQYNLALMYKRGAGVPKDNNEYLRWLTAAADQNLIPAQLDLASFCLHPADGTALDAARAIHYYELAAQHGSDRATVALGNIFATGLPGKPDYDLAVKWYRVAADHGQADGKFGLGERYALGQGVALDLTEARRLFTAAADQGQVNAQYNLAVMYEEANGTPADPALARHYFQLAAEQGMPQAQFRLGRLLASEHPSAHDRVAACQWLMLAQEFVKESSPVLSEVRKSMSAQEIAEAEHAVDNWRMAHR